MRRFKNRLFFIGKSNQPLILSGQSQACLGGKAGEGGKETQTKGGLTDDLLLFPTYRIWGKNFVF